jgi:hypothetical protein
VTLNHFPSLTIRTKEVSQEAEIQYRKQHLLSQLLVHDKHIMYMSHDLVYPNPTNTPDFLVLKINIEKLVALSQQGIFSEVMPLDRISSVSSCPRA